LLSAALAKLSTVVLGCDTGLMHVAVAMGKRVVMMMGSLQPGACYPFGHRDWAVLPPNGAPVAAISCEEINRACAEALTETGLNLAPAAR
jgi:ADP-heptose:LPS heptosyltransferase